MKSQDADGPLLPPELDAQSILRGLGFDAEKIDRTSDKTADFRVDGDEPGYLVEVKSRLLDERLNLKTPGISEPITKSMRHDAKVVDWLAQSKLQFKSLDRNHERLWLLWCSMESPFGGLRQFERTVSVLYGVREALNVMPPHENVLVFYATPGAFARLPDIDGAVVVLADSDGITFCPNEASPRFDLVMRSRLVKALREAGVGAMLPAERAAVTGGYVTPSEARSSEVEALRSVQRAKGLPYLTFQAMDVEYLQTGRVPLEHSDK